jgi:hypothetical protein
MQRLTYNKTSREPERNKVRTRAEQLELANRPECRENKASRDRKDHVLAT